MTDMTGEHKMITTFDVDPCEANGCAMQSEPLTVCVDHRYPHYCRGEHPRHGRGGVRHGLSNQQNCNER